MPLFRVSWVIDVEAETDMEAVEYAVSRMPFPGNDSIATVFEVHLEDRPEDVQSFDIAEDWK